MSFELTVFIMGLGAALMIVSQILERSARSKGDRSRYPVTLMLMLGAVLLLAPAGHLIALLTGVQID
jgi:NADH:ubiquinone oxidoreductase subunit 2 (subunit N)